MDELTKEELEQLLAVFRDQSLQILDEMSTDLLALESRGVDEETVTRLRRAAHTIKGDSACIGLTAITELAHKLEDMIDSAVAGKVSIGATLVNLMLDILESVRTAVGGDEVQDIPADELDRLSDRLIAVESAAPASPSGAGGARTQKSDSPQSGSSGVAQSGPRPRRDFVRVEAARIDALLNLAGEMVISRSIMNQITPELERALPKNDVSARLGVAGAQLGKLIAELQKSVLKMRMVTIDQVFRRFVRPMRDLAAERGKQVELDISGGETELDRTLVDLLYEPLLHLLRNAVDHGLETTEERLEAGKPKAGRITMRAYHEGNQIIVEVSDDGRGIDVATLKERAVEAGAITGTEAERMTDEEALDLIFLEGLSTAKKITRISGRGVGASTVRSAIEQMRGNVTLRTRPGEGTTFILRMPLTLAIIRGLLFTASGQIFALPLLSVSEIARMKTSDIVYLDGFESFRLRDRFISLVRPGLVLGFDRRRGGTGAVLRGDAETVFVIVLTVGNKKYGVLADGLFGEQELVIKPLDSNWLQNDALAGAAVLGDGRVVLIMDAGMVFRKAIKFERSIGFVREAYAG